MKIFPSPRQCTEFDGSFGYKISWDVCPWIWNFGKISSSFESISRFPSFINSSSICFFIWRHRNCDSLWKASSSLLLMYFFENCILFTFILSSYFQKVSQDILSVRETKSLPNFLLLLLLLPPSAYWRVNVAWVIVRLLLYIRNAFSSYIQYIGFFWLQFFVYRNWWRKSICSKESVVVFPPL